MNNVDWSKPIEAVHIVTGDATPVRFVGMCNDGTDDAAVAGVPDTYEVFSSNGDHFMGVDSNCAYRIRNVV